MINIFTLLTNLVMPKKLYILGAALNLIGLGTPDQPDAPDYAGAAEKTAEGNLDMAKYTTDVNRPDMYNPYGSSIWQKDDADNWTNRVNLSPEQQALYDQQNQNQLLQSDLAGQGLAAAGGMFADPFNTGDFGTRPDYMGATGDMPTYSGPQDQLETYGENRQNVMDAMLARVDTDIAKDTQQQEARLIASGIPKGSEAFNREMDLLNRKKTDARQQAEISATQMANLDYDRTLAGRQQNVSELQDQYKTGMLNRNQGISEAKDAYNFSDNTTNKTIQDALLNRQTPLNEYSALMSGTQVQNPAFQDFSQQQQILGPDYSGATSAQGQWDLAGWNADTAQNNAILGGLFSLGGAAIGG